jgi:hypothetical protein
MRLGIVEASQNKIGSLADQVLLYCYHYDPRTGRYGATITNIVRLAGLTTVIVLGSASRTAVSAREARSRDRNRTGINRYVVNLPLFPARASTMAGHVDALYFFLVAMAAFFTTLICRG